jgi:hypothetical protein
MKKYFLYFCYLFFLIILFYTFYKSEIVFEGLSRSFYIKFYLISFLGIILTFFSKYLPSALKKNISLFCTSIILSLMLVEGVLIVQKKNLEKKNYNLKIQQYKNFTKANFDERSKIKVYEDLKNKNQNVSIVYAPKNYFNPKKNQIMPLSGISLKKGINCNESGYYTYFFSDRYGFNNDDKLWENKTNDYLLLGDSYGFGACVKSKKNISSILRDKHKYKRLINLSWPGNGPLTEFATLREYINLIKPKKIIIQYYSNDLINLQKELKNPILINYLNDDNFSQNLIHKQDEVNKWTENIIQKEFNKFKTKKNDTNFKKISSIFIFFKLNNIRSFLKIGANKKVYKNYLNQYEKIMKKFKLLSDKYNSELIFIYMPSQSEIKNVILKKNSYEIEKRQLVLNVIKKLDIKIINTADAILKINDPLTVFPFKSPNHYNEKGYRIVADELAKHLN